MIEIVLASRNKRKIAELQALLSFDESLDIKVLSLDDIGYTEEIEEDGESFEENSIIKASVPASLGYIGIADDSGLAVDALGGAPGIYSARFSDDESDVQGTKDECNNNKLLRVMKDVEDENRGAAFVCTMACVLPTGCSYSVDGIGKTVELSEKQRARSGGKNVFVVRGECRGSILHEPHGTNGFGYDPLFYISELCKTFAELDAGEKNEISHRGRASQKFVRCMAKMVKR